MIEFVSLFLGLVAGSHPVEVAAGGPVARVELRLDGERVAAIGAPPWRREVDFGAELTPHELVAVAVDEAGREIGRARQWINLPRSRAEARLVVEPGGRTARLVAASLPHHRVEGVRVTFDGTALVVEDSGRIELPRYDPHRLHILSAELEFAGNLRSRIDLPVGGRFGTAVDTDLTAVPLFTSRPPAKLRPQELAGLLSRAGKTLPVVSTEAGRGEIVVVIEQDARLNLGELGLKGDRAAAEATRENPEGSPELPGSRSERLRPGERLRFVATVGDRRLGETVAFDLFPVSQPFTGAHGTLPFLLTHVTPGAEEGVQRTADAVAAAGVQAAAGNRPRALVLILGPEGEDGSRFAVPAVRRYLERLRVPLVVWSAPRVPTGLDGNRLAPEVATPWGPAIRVSSLGRLREAARRLRELLDGQVIAWVEGGHLPQDVELAPQARGLSLAGRRGG